jgi:hypothetical protein
MMYSESVLSKRFIDMFDRRERNKIEEIEVDSDVELEAMFARCLETGHIVQKHSNENNMSYGHVCRTCGKYFHRHISMTGRGSALGLR